MSFQNKLEYFLFYSLYKFVSLFKLDTARKLAKFLAIIFYYLIPIRKKVAFKNITIAFPEKSIEERKKILLDSYRNFATVFIEMLYHKNFTEQDVEKYVRVDEGEVERIAKIKSTGSGVILLSAHFGNWEAFASSPLFRKNVPTYIVVKQLRNVLVDEFTNNNRCKFGNKIIYLGTSIKEVFKALKEKKVIALLADQRAPKEALRMKFFNKETSVFTGPAQLSLKTKSPILLYFTVRQPDQNYKVIYQPLEIDENCSEEEKVVRITKRYFELLEENIKKYPDHWFWFHDRWRH